MDAMEQMKVNKDQLVQVAMTGAASALQPVVFKEGDSYCCLLGPDPEIGVMGCGDTALEAVKDWDDHLADHLSKAGEQDEVVRHVREVLSNMNASKQAVDKIKAANAASDIDEHLSGISDPDTAKQVRDFYEQFKPRKG
jgi:hypothetical protein